MQARFNWQSRPKIGRPPPGRPPWRGRLLIGALAGLFLLWLGYRYLLQPAWIGRLPALAVEVLGLLQVAGAFTLGLLLALLWWQAHKRKTAVSPLSIDELYALSPADFERYVADLFRRKGYAVKMRGRSGDRGVDLELTQRGGKRAIVQCKRYRHTVGAEVVRELFGTLIHERAAHAFLVTTAEISDAAREWARYKPLTLIDGETLVRVAAVLQAGEDGVKRENVKREA